MSPPRSRRARPPTSISGVVVKDRAFSTPLHRYAQVTAGCAFLLVIAGGLVTSTGSSLAVPDWPLSFGQVFPPMKGGVLYEHGHRMIASLVGLLVSIMAVWLWRQEPRRWVRFLGLTAFLAVVTQGVLGGITVLMRLPLPVSVAHACLGQVFFCLVVTLAMVTSREWADPDPKRTADEGTPGLRALGVATTGVIFLQLVLGAIVRHTGAGLAIPDFPLSMGRLVPPVLEGPILIAYLHRLGAVAVAVMVIWTAGRILGRQLTEPRLVLPALGLLMLLFVQIALGGLTVLSSLAVIPATAHVATGALLMAMSLATTLSAFRCLDRPERSASAVLPEAGVPAGSAAR
jgi:heme a synthase